MAAHSKCAKRVTASGVRISLSPQNNGSEFFRAIVVIMWAKAQVRGMSPDFLSAVSSREEMQPIFVGRSHAGMGCRPWEG